ncbi:MAG: cytochrome P460 family protein [Nitrococcus sp.]|nr:cytochrome P460 family protein [Nitrococcus sp.]
MNYHLRLVTVLCALSPLYAYGGGNPDSVKFPEGYDQSFAHYATINRDNQKQVAKLYANETAVSSYEEGQSADPGSVVVMEIYKPKLDAAGKPIPGSDGIFEIDTLAAIAVMEKKDSWDAAYPENERAGNWGFALYKPDGTALSNELECAQCHSPLKKQDYLFTYQNLIDYAKEH